MLWRSPSKLTFDANRAERVRSARHVVAVGEVSARHGPQRVRSWRSFCRASHCPSRLKVTLSDASWPPIDAPRKVYSPRMLGVLASFARWRGRSTAGPPY
jgi:hypothetical protein